MNRNNKEDVTMPKGVICLQTLGGYETYIFVKHIQTFEEGSVERGKQICIGLSDGNRICSTEPLAEVIKKINKALRDEA